MKDNTKYRLIILLTLVLVRSCVGLIWSSVGPILPLVIKEFELSRSSASWMASITPLTIAVMSLPVTIIGSRYSPKKMFAIGACLQAGGILTIFANNYVFLLFTRVLFAAGTAIIVPMAVAIAVHMFTSRRLPLINSIIMVSINLGSAAAFVATVPIATAFSWKTPLIIYGGVALTFAMAWIIFGKELKESNLINDVPETPTNKERHDLTVKQIITSKSTILLMLAMMGASSLGNSIGSWLPSYYNEVFDMPLEKASSILVVITVGGTLACLAGGVLATRLGRHRPLLIVSGIFMGLTAIASILFNNMTVIYASVALYGVFANLWSPSILTIPMELPGMSIRSGAIMISIMIVGGNIGNFIGPLIIGALTDITESYLPGFITTAVLSMSLLAAGLLLNEKGQKVMKI